MAKPNYTAPLAPAYDVIVSGDSLLAEIGTVLREIVVADDLALPGMFTIELAGDTQHALAPPLLDDSRVAPGAEVDIRLGYADGKDSVITGIIAAIEADFAASRPPLLRMRGYDARQKLQRGRNSRTFTGSTDSQVVEQIAGFAGLPIDTTDSDISHDYLMQADQSDFAFILARAAAIGFELVMRSGKLAFRPAGFDGAEALTLDVAADLLEFCPSLSLAQQPSAVEWRGWSVADKQDLTSTAESGAERAVLGTKSSASQAKQAWGDVLERIGTAPVASQPEGDAIARARFDAMSLSLVTAEGLSFGRTDLMAGTVVKINGAGTMFSGDYYISSVRHRFTPRSGYTTRFSARRNAT